MKKFAAALWNGPSAEPPILSSFDRNKGASAHRIGHLRSRYGHSYSNYVQFILGGKCYAIRVEKMCIARFTRNDHHRRSHSVILTVICYFSPWH